MISLVSSYKAPASDREGGPLPTLRTVFAEAVKHGFASVDVYVSSADIRMIAGKVTTQGRIWSDRDRRLVARALADSILESRELAGAKSIAVPALATNIPNISSPRKDKRDESSRNLAVCLLAAHSLGVKVVQIVCGRRVRTRSKPGKNLTSEAITDPHDTCAVSELAQCFYSGLYESFRLCKTRARTDYWPEVAVALEMEPHLLALARDVREAVVLIQGYRGFLRNTGLSEHDRLVLDGQIGLNLDWGHALISLDRSRLEGDRKEALRELMAWLRGLAKPKAGTPAVSPIDVLHHHVCDHAPGAHWQDAPLGQFRGMTDYDELIRFFNDTTRRSDSPFCTKELAMEIEACNSIDIVCQSRDLLLSHAKEIKSPISLPQGLEASKIERVESLLAELTEEDIRKGWLEGVNRTIYYALEDYVERFEGNEDQDALLRCSDLTGLRQFLCERRPGNRARIALQIVKDVFNRIGFKILGEWADSLLDAEYGGAFHTGYRDHSVHVLYVYLLGWYLYVSSPVIRKMFGEEGERASSSSFGENPFARKWALAALGHDLGYVFESEEERVTEEAIMNLNRFRDDFLMRGTLERVDGSIQDDIKTVLNLDGNTDLLNPEEITEEGEFFEILGEYKKVMRLGTRGGFRGFFELCGGKKEGGGAGDLRTRGPYFDHGVMSAALVYILQRWQIHWAEKFRSRQFKPEGDLDSEWVAEFKEWGKATLGRIWFPKGKGKGELDEILAAIAAHNIHPERDDANPKVFAEELFKKYGLTLRGFELNSKTPMAFFLGVCDELQDWGRAYFGNPSDEARTMILPLEVRLETDPKGKVSFDFVTDTDVTKEKRKVFDYRFGRKWRDFLVLGEDE